MFEKFAEDILSRYYEKLAWLANKSNFTHGTSANFSPASRPDRKPDFTSKSDSEYWNTPMGVIRGSDHWGTVGSCDWKLGKKKYPGKKVYGFSAWENFQKKNKTEKKAAVTDITKLPEGIRRHLRLSILDDPNAMLEFVPESWEGLKSVDFDKIVQVGRQNPVSAKSNVLNNPVVSLCSMKPSKPINTINAQAAHLPSSNLKTILDGILSKRIMGFNKHASALSDVDVSNWDNLSTEERNAIIKLMKPHTFAQLPGDNIGHGYEGVAYRGISPDFGEVTDDAPFNAVIKKFYGFEGEKPRFQARYDIAYNDPEIGKDPEFDKFMQRKFEKPEIKALIEAGEMAKAEKLLRKMESGTWRHGTRKYNLLANPKNSNILAKVIENAFDPSYEAYLDGSHSGVKQVGGLVMERLDIPDMGSLDEGEFKMLNKELANRIDEMHLGDDKGYGTKELDDRHEHANGELGRSMVFRPMLKDRHGKKWIITDAHNAFTKEEANGMHNYWMHNMGMDREGKLKIYDFMERKVK